MRSYQLPKLSILKLQCYYYRLVVFEFSLQCLLFIYRKF